MKPEFKGNTNNIKEVCFPHTAINFLRKEQLADYYLIEPAAVHVQTHSQKDFIEMEQVFYCAYWKPNLKAIGMSVYLDSEDSDDSLVIRLTEWNIKRDQSFISKEKLNPSSNQQLWPSLSSEVAFINGVDCSGILRILNAINNNIQHGISLNPKEREPQNEKWQDVSFMMKLDWGSIKATWNNNRSNFGLEKCFVEMEHALRTAMKKPKDMVQEIVLDFSVLPETQYQIVFGNEKE